MSPLLVKSIVLQSFVRNKALMACKLTLFSLDLD